MFLGKKWQFWRVLDKFLAVFTKLMMSYNSKFETRFTVFLAEDFAPISYITVV